MTPLFLLICAQYWGNGIDGGCGLDETLLSMEEILLRQSDSVSEWAKTARIGDWLHVEASGQYVSDMIVVAVAHSRREEGNK